MSELKITIEQLKNYLETELKVIRRGMNDELIGIRNGKAITERFGICSIDELKLRCYRLSDLDKFIPELGFVPIDKMFG